MMTVAHDLDPARRERVLRTAGYDGPVRGLAATAPAELPDVLRLVRRERASMTPACEHSAKMVSFRGRRRPGTCAGQVFWSICKKCQ
jgi:hypothetical protein